MLKRDIEKIVKPVINDNDCFLWGIEILRGKKNTTLRIFIDSENGVDINDCENISKDLNYEPSLDLKLGENYILEVSTPGIDRKFFEIGQLNDYIGQDLLLKCKQLHNGKRNFSGTLSECNENILFLMVKNKILNFNFNDIDLCKLKPNFKKLMKENNYAK